MRILSEKQLSKLIDNIKDIDDLSYAVGNLDSLNPVTDQVRAIRGNRWDNIRKILKTNQGYDVIKISKL